MSFKVIFSAFLLFGVTAQAAELAPTALITKVNQSGFTPVDYRSKETCQLYRTRVVVTKEMGIEGSNLPVILRRVFPVMVSSNITEMIRQAQAEELQESNIQVCDAPSTYVTAAAPGIASFVLFSSGSCSKARTERIGGSSYQLRKIIDGFCPETNDVGGEN